jgi:nicotinamidase-related amidase
MSTLSMALILVDIQNDYFPGGRMELEGSPEAGIQANHLLTAFRSQALPIVHIQHVSTRPGATFFLPNTEGVEIHSSVTPLAGEPVFQKHFPNSFRETPLLGHLQPLGIKKLVIAGMMTHMCIDATTRAAFDFGFECVVIYNACATRALKFSDQIIPAQQVHGAFLAALASSYAKIQNVDELISSLSASLKSSPPLEKA